MQSLTAIVKDHVARARVWLVRQTWLIRVIDIVIDAQARVTRLLLRHRKPVAIGGSVALHLLLLALMLRSPSVSLSGGQGTGGNEFGDGESFGIDLVTTEQQSPMPELKDLTNELKELENLREVEPIKIDSANRGIAELAPPYVIEPIVLPGADMGVSGSQMFEEAKASAGGSGQGGVGEDELWKAIAPCWRKLADAETIPVTLSITFSSEGRLAKPPVIKRDGNLAINQQSLRSEAIALMALSQCGAYTMASGRQDVEVNFPVQ